MELPLTRRILSSERRRTRRQLAAGTLRKSGCAGVSVVINTARRSSCKVLCYVCQTSPKLKLSRQILVPPRPPNIKFHAKPPNGSRTDGRLASQTGTLKLTVVFRSFATRLKSDFTARYCWLSSKVPNIRPYRAKLCYVRNTSKIPNWRFRKRPVF